MATVPPSIEFHPLAVEEARAARRWYARRSPAVAARFLAAIDQALARIEAGPDLWPTYLHGTRVFRLRRFPYLIVFRQTRDALQIVAVAHARRRPGYWRRRT